MVSVVLCARNAAEVVERQLAALAAQDLTAPWELVVVDNASRDATVDVVRSACEAQRTWRLVREPASGVNRARNSGVRATGAPLVVHCDADDEVDAAWLRHLVTALADADVVGGRLVDDPTAHTTTHWRNEAQRDELPRFFGRPYSFGATLGYRREVFDRLGGFDITYEHGGNDVEFCIRAADAGCVFAFVPDAVVRYRPRPTRWLLVRQQFRYGRGHQCLAATRNLPGASGSLGRRSVALLDDWARSVRLLPRLARAKGRDELLARIAYLSGEAVELVSGVRRRSQRS